MSLDVYLKLDKPIPKKGTGVFVRENGMNKELSEQEVQEKFTGSFVPETEYESNCVFEANITHNLNTMAEQAGIYKACWRPEEINATKAKDILPILEIGLKDLKARPAYFKQYNPKNGWGTYDNFISWVEKYMNACKEYPEAIIEVSR